jgi:hypothetical protein
VLNTTNFEYNKFCNVFYRIRYSTFTAISTGNKTYSNDGVAIKRTRTEEEYFEDDEDQDGR